MLLEILFHYHLDVKVMFNLLVSGVRVELTTLL